MDEQNKNLILATVLSFLVITVWLILFPPPEPEPAPATPDATQVAGAGETTVPAADPAEPADTAAEAATMAAPDGLNDAPRLQIDTPELEGSISLLGGRIDDLRLKLYRVDLSPDSDIVTLFRPQGQAEAYYTLYGWAPGSGLTLEDVPGATTLWTVEGNDRLTPESPVTLIWDNGKGLVFRRVISVDDKYMFTVTQSVENTGDSARRLAPYGVIRRHGLPADLSNFYILHEGAIVETGEEMQEISYKDMRKADPDPKWGASAQVVRANGNGWVGFTDHYWMSTLIPAADQGFDAVLKYYGPSDIYTTWAELDTIEVPAGGSASTTTRLFAGAKEWETIREYERQAGVYKFIDSIDWGWFYFITKPMFAILHYLNKLIGNMGWAIIALTLVVKAALFPLAYKSYVSMAKMKELQPELEKLKERVGDDKQRLQKETMELYRREKVNPAAGCLPIFLQIPIFFSLYKVIFVTLELRHAPWIGWIRDLSAPDPSSIFNLFGLLPWAPPEPGTLLATFSIGVLPILLGVTMWLQQKLNPAPTDPTQKMIFAWMPWVFMFMLGQFASGLVLYWITSNTLTFAQQYAIMRSHGHKPDVFGNIMSSFRRKPKDGE